MHGSSALIERVARSASGLSLLFLTLAGAWYFSAAVWWLLKHDWPDWTWRSGFGWGAGASPLVQFLASRSPGATALIAAGIVAVAARIVDPVRPRH